MTIPKYITRTSMYYCTYQVVVAPGGAQLEVEVDVMSFELCAGQRQLIGDTLASSSKVPWDEPPHTRLLNATPTMERAVASKTVGCATLWRKRLSISTSGFVREP